MRKVITSLALGMIVFHGAWADPIKHIIQAYSYKSQNRDSIRRYIKQNVDPIGEYIKQNVVPASYAYQTRRDYSYNGINNDFIQRLKDVAFQYLGIPYRFGGNSRYGIDCSAFTMDVFKSLGISLPRTAEAQARYGKLVLHRLKPGDLLFFKDTYKPGISHVGIYIGNGKMIEASSVYGRVVVEDVLNDPYLVRHFAFARRILP